MLRLALVVAYVIVVILLYSYVFSPMLDKLALAGYSDTVSKLAMLAGAGVAVFVGYHLITSEKYSSRALSARFGSPQMSSFASAPSYSAPSEYDSMTRPINVR